MLLGKELAIFEKNNCNGNTFNLAQNSLYLLASIMPQVFILSSFIYGRQSLLHSLSFMTPTKIQGNRIRMVFFLIVPPYARS